MTPDQRKAARERCNGATWWHVKNREYKLRDFIEHARTDLPLALDALDAADKRIAELEAEVEKYFDRFGA